MLPQNAPSHIQRRKPGSRGTVEPSGSLIGPPLACGSSSAATNAAGSVAIFCNSSRAATSSRTLSADQPRSNAALYSGRNSSAGLTSWSILSSVAAADLRIGPNKKAPSESAGPDKERDTSVSAQRPPPARRGGSCQGANRSLRRDACRFDYPKTRAG